MIISVLDSCTGCGRCVAVCPAHAISLKTEKPDGFGRKTAVIDTSRCHACHTCSAACPHQALSDV
ncbi:MAG: 4Fe-4S binding protein [Desulfuromonadales bacterium]|nr:4Fe-4S binding protein [Desulfuromonadales bacterium]MBN2793070.1 4Fe-4S binding protein [Desulfuromonadales bacterium]